MALGRQAAWRLGAIFVGPCRQAAWRHGAVASSDCTGLRLRLIRASQALFGRHVGWRLGELCVVPVPV